MNDFSEEYVENYEQKCLCVLVLDVSNLLGPAQIAEMNKSLQEFYKIIQEDETTSQRMEFCIITYGEGVSIIQEPCTVERFSMPAIPSSKSLPAVSEAVNEAIEKVNARKRWYKATGQSYYRPMIVLVSSKKYNSVYENPLYEILKRDISEKKYSFVNFVMDGKIHQEEWIVSIGNESKNFSSALHEILTNEYVSHWLT